MNYSDYIYQILGFVGLPALFTLYLTERVKGNIKSTYDRKLEEIKKENTKEIEEVKKEHSKEISQFQSELNYLKSKENFKFTKLHEKRFEALSETYAHLSKILYLLHRYMESVSNLRINNSGSDESSDIENNFKNAFSESSEYIFSNMLFFDDKTEQLLIDYFIKCGEFFNVYDQFKHMKKINAEENLGYTIEIDSTYKKLEESILPIKKEIEKEFRKFLGE